MNQKEQNEKPSNQTQSAENQYVHSDQTSGEYEKPPEPPNVIFKVEKDCSEIPLIHFEKKYNDKKSEE